MRETLIGVLRCILAELTRPGPLYFTVDQWGDDMAKFKVRVLLPATKPSDHVAAREVTLTLDDGTPVVETLAADAGQYDFFGNEGQKAKVSLVDKDAAGNRSAPSEGETTITDTIPPQQPGALAFTTIEEVDETPPT